MTGKNNKQMEQPVAVEEPAAQNKKVQQDSKPPLIVIPGGKNEAKEPWAILGLQDAYKDAEMPPWVIKDLVMANTVTLVSAHPHAMKSLSWLYASLEGVVTQKVFGHFEAPNLKSVLFIETEDPEWLVKKRLQGFAKGLKLDPNREIQGFHFTCPGPFDLTAEVKRLESLIKQYDLDLIVLSTLQNVLGGASWKEQQEMANVLATLVKTARLCPIVVLTHSPQDKRQKRAAGSITLPANCATLIHYDKTKDKGETFVSLTVDSKAGATETAFTLKLLRNSQDGDPVSSVRGLVYAGRGKKRKPSDKDAILEMLRENPDSTTEDIVEATGAKERNVQKVRKEFIKSRQEGGEPDEANTR